MKLCLLTFTRNNFDEAIDKVRRYYEFFDKFIIIENSSEPPPDPGLSKVIVHRAPSFGYADPLHQFGVRKTVEAGCDWVVKLDVDEELSEHLLRDLRDILNNSSCDAYSIALYVYDPISNHMGYESDHLRIFRPSKAYFNGIIHESEAQAQIHGKRCKLDTKYHVKHIQEIPLYKDYEKLKRYAEIESFERPPTLRTLILRWRRLARTPRLLSLLSKFPLPATVLPYPIFFVNLQLYRWSIRKLIGKAAIFGLYFYNIFIYRYMRSLDPRELVTRVHIAVDMYRVGDVTRYLCLDRDDIVERLARVAERVKNSGGVDFFEILMKLRYISGGCDYVDRLEKILGVA